jgi:hypothetical protein
MYLLLHQLRYTIVKRRARLVFLLLHSNCRYVAVNITFRSDLPPIWTRNGKQAINLPSHLTRLDYCELEENNLTEANPEPDISSDPLIEPDSAIFVLPTPAVDTGPITCPICQWGTLPE